MNFRNMRRQLLESKSGKYAIIIVEKVIGKSKGPKGFKRYKPIRYSDPYIEHVIVYAKIIEASSVAEARKAYKGADREMDSIFSQMDDTHGKGYMKSMEMVLHDIDNDRPVKVGDSRADRGILHQGITSSNDVLSRWKILKGRVSKNAEPKKEPKLRKRSGKVAQKVKDAGSYDWDSEENIKENPTRSLKWHGSANRVNEKTAWLANTIVNDVVTIANWPVKLTGKFIKSGVEVSGSTGDFKIVRIKKDKFQAVITVGGEKKSFKGDWREITTPMVIAIRKMGMK